MLRSLVGSEMCIRDRASPPFYSNEQSSTSTLDDMYTRRSGGDDSGPCDDRAKTRDLFDGVGVRDIIGLVLSALGLMVAAGGGIGGGGILVPIYILVMDFSPKTAIPLSNVTILGGSISNIYLNSKKRHPYADRPCIDYDLANLMEPLTIAGAVVGSLMNKILVPWIITVMLVALLGFTTWNTYKKAMIIYKKESIEFEEAERLKAGGDMKGDSADSASATGGAYGSVSKEDIDDEHVNVGFETARNDLDDKLNEELEAMIEGERGLPVDKTTVLIVCFIGVILMSVIKGTAVKCGGIAYWVISFLPVPWALAVGFYVRHILLTTHDRKCMLQYPFQPGDVRWTSRATIIYPLMCSMAGIFAGLFGIGGGIVKGPLMLEMQVHPSVASATAAYMILFTAGAATLSYAFLGEVEWTYAWLMFSMGVIFTLVGQLLLNKLIKRTGRSSYIAFVIVAIVGISVVLMGVEGVRTSVKFIENDCSYQPHVCRT
eukprot:TRINITY_DN369_c0_g1_i5.p1 TRINITY_DN369_c0_g1~~TRINITY_DN369_c0_g1_i5.p1  ORF type:complete len:536 (+),score=154.29 TRINITY_DN369_c0_g1_i5:146-1609(+)